MHNRVHDSKCDGRKIDCEDWARQWFGSKVLVFKTENKKIFSEKALHIENNPIDPPKLKNKPCHTCVFEKSHQNPSKVPICKNRLKNARQMLTSRSQGEPVNRITESLGDSGVSNAPDYKNGCDNSKGALNG